MSKVMIIGAASAIATEAAKCFAKNGDTLLLADLKMSRLEAVKDDILVHAKVPIHLREVDATDFARQQDFFNEAVKALDGLDAILMAQGVLPDQEATQADMELLIKTFNINAMSVITLAGIAGNYFEAQKKGCIAAISSVAGDRGRQSNYIYGAAKGAVSIYFEGLRNRLFKSGVAVVTIKPGFVDTPMTAHLNKNFLYSKPSVIGEMIYNAMQSGKEVAYTPGFWRLVMLAVRHVPEGIFKRMSM